MQHVQVKWIGVSVSWYIGMISVSGEHRVPLWRCVDATPEVKLCILVHGLYVSQALFSDRHISWLHFNNASSDNQLSLLFPIDSADQLNICKVGQGYFNFFCVCFFYLWMRNNIKSPNFDKIKQYYSYHIFSYQTYQFNLCRFVFVLKKEKHIFAFTLSCTLSEA